MYKLYIKENSMYKNPKLFKDLETAIANARGEYLIIKEENGTDTIVKSAVALNPERKDDDDEWSR
jgi:hypothetical protein